MEPQDAKSHSVSSLKEGALPRHMAIIMDGNGRWAQDKNLSRSEGHKKGADVLDILFDTILKLGIPYVSLYAFSTENWKRPRTEVNALFELLNRYLKIRLNKMVENGIQMRVSGDVQGLPMVSRKLVTNALKKTSEGKNLVANFCINYGSHDEIVRAVENILREKNELQPKEKLSLTWSDIEQNLYTSGMPPVDLLIRSGGEQRLSNFLLLQAAYAEIYFTPTLWPEFNESELFSILYWYGSRLRRFGGLNEGSKKVKSS